MPTRTIKLKMILPRGERGRATRLDLWTTHALVNGAVKRIEDVLLLCRGRPYRDTQGNLHSQDEVRAQTVEYARNVQRGNSDPGEGDDDQIVALLRRLYESIVTSSVSSGTGNAQQARGFVGPLMSATSQGGKYAAKKVLETLPGWVLMMQQGDSAWEACCQDWLHSDEAKLLMNATGAPPRWVRLHRKGEPWQEAFLAHQERLRTQTVNDPLESLRRVRLLPLFKPPIRSTLAGARGAVSVWEYLAMGLAVAHLNSWESNDHRAQAEYAELAGRIEVFKQKVDGDALERVRAYERLRHDELKRVALADDNNPYRVGRRALRGWEYVRERWRSSGCRDNAERMKVLAEIQTRLRGRFGDPHFYHWLAQEPQEKLWRDADPLPDIVLLNDAVRRLARKKNGSAFTAADPCLHPRWVQYERSGGGNLQTYEVEQDGRALYVRLPLLHHASPAVLEEVEHRIRLAPSDQFAQTQVQPRARRGDGPAVSYVSAGQVNKALLGNADILLRRSHLENRPIGQVSEGEIGPVWLKIALEIVPQIPLEWQPPEAQAQIKATIGHFMHAANRKQGTASAPVPGLRVLSVDLGVRTFAACSVFTLGKKEPEEGLHFSAHGTERLWACHERSFLLALPGECPKGNALTCREVARQEMADLRLGVSYLNALLHLSVEPDPGARRAMLSQWMAEGTFYADAFGGGGLAPLLELADAEPSVWENAVLKQRAHLEAWLGERMSQWRRRTRPRANGTADHRERRGYHGGKSMWSVQYLTDVRRLLLRWSLHGRQSGHIRRQDRKQGVFSAHLLGHINALKDDRTKTGADLIVQAARGMARDSNGHWHQAYAPCPVILFENLARYRFKTDRPRRENSQLMRWAHREIYREATMQAEAYGIRVIDTAAGFSSRYHAKTGAPGLRVRRVSQHDLDDQGIRHQMLEVLENLPGVSRELHVGDLVPWQGGPDFVTLAPGGQLLVVVHADINAAQNLQRRLWMRHTDAYRMAAGELDGAGQETWVPNPLGSRLQGALIELGATSGYAHLVAAPNGDGYVVSPMRKADWVRAVGAGTELDDESDTRKDEDRDADMLDDLGTAVRTRTTETFFRDPSGIVLPADRWYPAKAFWGRVEARIVPLLRMQPEHPF
jgi:hypothetical protein